MNETEPDLAARVAALEARLGAPAPATGEVAAAGLHPAVALATGLVALATGYLGLGLPSHYYQLVFAALTLLVSYHRRMLLLPRPPWHWPQVLLNYGILCLFFKLLIGAGTTRPLGWIKVPAIEKKADPEPSWWDPVIPKMELVWRDVANVTDWSVDITRIQTLLLVATLAGAMMRFQPFASLTALTLLIVSLPTLLGFQWDWVMAFLITGGGAFYLQWRDFSVRR